MSNIIIEEDIKNEILSAIGYPLITIEDTELENEDNLKELVVKPSLREYFKHFPIIYSQDYRVSGGGSFDFEAPTELANIFNAVVKMNNSGITASLAGGNIFSKLQYIHQSASSSIGANYDYGLKASSITKTVEAQSFNNTMKAFRYDFDRITKRNVKGYSNVTGQVEVQWMCFSNDTKQIMYERINDFIMYCQGILLIQLAMIRGQMNANQGNTSFNADMFLSNGTELRNKALENYKGVIMNPVVIRI